MKRILSDQEKKKVKQELGYMWTESKPQFFGAFKFLFSVIIQPQNWKKKYMKLGKEDKDMVQTGSFLILVIILCVWLVKHYLFG